MPKGILFIFMCILLCHTAAAQLTADTNWTKKKAARWVKSREWAHGASLGVHPSTDKVEFARQYHKNKEAWDKSFIFINEHKLEDLAPGRYPVDGDNAYISITEGPSKKFEQTNWESHRKYIDLQYIIKGKEKIGVAPSAHAVVSKPYDADKDVMNYTTEGKFYVAQPGKFFLFFPQDAHRPSVVVEGSEVVKKLVVKIKVAS